MPKRATDGPIKLKFPIPSKRLDGKRHEWYHAAWFIAETYRFNPKANINEEKVAVEEGWRTFALETWPDCADDMLIELRTPRVWRLWADLWLQYATYTRITSPQLPPLQQIVNWALGDVDKVAVLFGHPGFVIWVPFYGDTPMRDLKYSDIDDGIRALNPEFSITSHIVESIFLHIVRNEYWAESEDNIWSFVDRELLCGGEVRQGSRTGPLFMVDDLSFETVMIIPRIANSYEEFNTASHYLNPRSSITREQVYESYRWLLILRPGLTGDPLVEALRGALPTDINLYHDAVKGVGTALSKQILGGGAPPSKEPDKRFFSITYACRCMLKTTTIHGVLPLIRFSFTPHKNVMAAFSQQYRLLNPGVKLTKAGVDRAWRAMLSAPLPAPTAGPETAVPDDTVAEKAPPCEDSEVRQLRGDEVQGPAVGRAAAGDESDSSRSALSRGFAGRRVGGNGGGSVLRLRLLLRRLRLGIDRGLVLECR